MVFEVEAYEPNNTFCFSLTHSNDFSKMVAEEYLTFFEFTGMTLDQSLRYLPVPPESVSTECEIQNTHTILSVTKTHMKTVLDIE